MLAKLLFEKGVCGDSLRELSMAEVTTLLYGSTEDLHKTLTQFKQMGEDAIGRVEGRTKLKLKQKAAA